jgi:small subunit ribosomal protein S16
MLVIRFFRVGKKNQPSFKIVVTDKRKPTRAGRFAEEVGFWNPLTKEKVLKKERILYWISVGAQPSKSLHNLLVSEKIIEGKKIPRHKKKKIKKETSPEIPSQTQPEIKKDYNPPTTLPPKGRAPEKPKESPKT